MFAEAGAGQLGYRGSEGDGARPWLAAYTRPRFEEKVRSYCDERGIETFLPCHRSWRTWSDRKKLLQVPLFPSYVFIRPQHEESRRAMQAPGFLWYVRGPGGPVQVCDNELVAVRRLLGSGLAYDPLPAAELDSEVEVVRGALRGCRGWLVRKEQGAIVLRVKAVGGSVRVRVPDPSWIRQVHG